MYRNKEGDTEISKPADDNAVKMFVENDLGLDELFVNDLLRNE